MTAPHHLVSLLDVDDTLYDNDAFEADLTRQLTHTLGAASRDRYWQIYEQLRRDAGYADYLGALERLRLERPHDPRVLRLSTFLLGDPFAARLYPGALDVIHRLQRWGPTVIVSDGDAVYQPHKIVRAGLLGAAHGHVLVFVHKERELDEVERRYPAAHYLLIDDKPAILDAVKQRWGARVTTIQVRQGHYARDPRHAALPTADLTIERIGDLLGYDRAALLSGACEESGPAPAA